MGLSELQTERYSRHIILKDIGVEGQEKLLNGKVLIIGTGGLGSPAALYLAAAGVGTIGLVDGDTVDLSNLQRQIIHFTPDLERPKVESAAEKIKQINPDVTVNSYNKFAKAENILDLVMEYDFVIDGTDNFPAKFLINDACVMAKKPYSHGGILKFDGQTLTYKPGSACLRCVFENLPPKNTVPTCSQAGVLGAVAGMLGTIQTAEAIKYITGVGNLLENRMLTFNALAMEFMTINIKRNSGCPVCGTTPVITELQDYEQPVCDLIQKKNPME